MIHMCFMKRFIAIGLLYIVQPVKAQELFTFTEPASNMATSNMGIRLNNYFMNEAYSSKTDYHLVPEVMVGINKKLMLHGEVFFSNLRSNFSFEGGAVYGKYRFYSMDEVHAHLRMAAFGKLSRNNGIIHQQAIDLNGHNSGYETGVIVTKLLNKFAFSASASFLHATDNSNDHKFFYSNAERNAIGYTFSAGKLLLPKEYTDYKQTNLNAMVEFLGQVNPGSGLGYFDIAPSLQVIINSVARIDIGQRIKLSGKLQRSAPGGTFVRLEYNLFNVFK
jgi:hypothetical protein